MVACCCFFRNAEGETLSDLLNNWQPKKRGPSGTESQKTLFNQLLHTVKANLGGKYCLLFPNIILSPDFLGYLTFLFF